MRYLTFLFLFSLIQSCRFFSDTVIGTVYVIEDKVCLYEKPTRQSECLSFSNRNSVLSVTELKVEDSQLGKQAFWRKVLSEGKSAYLPIEGEMSRFQFVTVRPVEKKYSQIVSASNLRLRQSPSLKSDVLALLPKGDQVFVTGASVSRYTIDGLTNAWVQIESSTGKKGFVFDGYLENEKIVSDDDSFNEDGEESQGFVVLLSSEPVVYTIPGKVKGYQSAFYCSEGKDFQENKKLDKRLGKYFKVTNSQKIDEETFYLIRKKIVESNDSESSSTCYSAWISEKDVTYHEGEFSDWNVNQFRSRFSEKFLKYAKAETLDFERTELNPISFSADNNKHFFLAKIFRFSSELQSGGPLEVLLEETDVSFVSLFSDSFETFQFEDFNGDGIPEILAINDFRGSFQEEYFQNVNGKALKFLSAAFSEYESNPNRCTIELHLVTGLETINVNVNDSDPYNQYCNLFSKNGKVGIYNHKTMYTLEKGLLTPVL